MHRLMVSFSMTYGFSSLYFSFQRLSISLDFTFNMDGRPIFPDAVVYQNWLMKRSQMTRLFRRRFAVLTAQGKLYSFRKVDLSKPESISPSAASLVWDIRGCCVESSPKSGENTFVIRPTGPYLNEDVFLRTCSVDPVRSCFHWIQALSAVARNNSPDLYQEARVLNLRLNIPGDAEIYVETEGSLYPLHRQDQLHPEYSSQIPLRSNHPGSTFILKAFTADNGGESPQAQSIPVPRYRVFKSLTTLPWTSPKDEKISLYGENGNVFYSGTLFSSVNEAARDYFEPIFATACPSQSFDVSSFKFQIKRLVRLIDLIGVVKDQIGDIFEWKNEEVSMAWMLYLCFAFAIIPDLIHILAVLHLLLYSLARSSDAMAWWSSASLSLIHI